MCDVTDPGGRSGPLRARACSPCRCPRWTSPVERRRGARHALTSTVELARPGGEVRLSPVPGCRTPQLGLVCQRRPCRPDRADHRRHVRHPGRLGRGELPGVAMLLTPVTTSRTGLDPSSWWRPGPAPQRSLRATRPCADLYAAVTPVGSVRRQGGRVGAGRRRASQVPYGRRRHVRACPRGRIRSVRAGGGCRGLRRPGAR
jgi:hypothetical protein